MRATSLFLVLFILGCGRGPFAAPDFEDFKPAPLPPRDAAPIEVIADTGAVVVIMDDGAQCLGAAGADFAAGGWTGTLRECPYEYSYAVQLAAGAPPGQVLLSPAQPRLPQERDAAPFRPFVAVDVTDFSGRRFRFESAQGF